MFVTKLDVVTYLCHKHDTVSTKYQTNVMYSSEESRRKCVIDLVVWGFTNAYCLIEPTLTKEVIRELYEKVKLYRLSGCSSSNGYKIIGCLPDSERAAKEAKNLADYLRTIDYGVVVEFLDNKVVSKYREFHSEVKTEVLNNPLISGINESIKSSKLTALGAKESLAIGLVLAGFVWVVMFGVVSKIKTEYFYQPMKEKVSHE